MHRLILSGIFFLSALLVSVTAMSLPAESTSSNQPSTTTTCTEITCDYCQATFPSRSKLFKHLRANHNLDAQLEAQSRLESLTPSERTQASIAARGTYQNAAHEAYYRAQMAAGVFSQEEWETAGRYFRRPLPVAFRLLHHNLNPTDVRYQCWQRLQRLVPPDSLEACPPLNPQLAQVAAIPPRQWSEEAQQALMDCQEVGVANRQEVCSMIPPLLLLQEGDCLERGTLLDLCAAPGSKSLQLMDQMGEHLANDPKSGLLVCNDANRQRLLTVARRSRRQPSHIRQSVCLNSSDGRYFPALRKWGGYKLKFDRVLADVPCSGDGTLRKLSAKEWRNWNVKLHLSLHRLQVRLLTRALECVGKGGRLVYSTCSLDPVEDEAVLVTAIARRGGPSVYKIVPIPERLSTDAQEPFSYTPGTTNWVVPHSQFGKTPKSGGAAIYDTFESIDQVPPALRKKDISPSMFPPRARTQANVEQIWKDHENKEEKLQHARFYGELLSPEDIARFEAMLPNCGRILPQHLDSGGFFCAIVERVSPSFYPVCYPLERSRREANEASTTTADGPYKYHGRILANVASGKHIRKLVAQDKLQGDDVRFEGVATMELALEWLKKHRAYQPGLSEQRLEMPSTDSAEEEETDAVTPRPFKPAYVNDPNRSHLYSRLFPPPHPLLVEEFCDYFGLVSDPEEACKAGVDVFPAQRLVVMGGGKDALTVTTCQDPNQAHRVVRRDDPLPDNEKVNRKRRFLQLVLVSEGARNLFHGGAKFNPMEVGLGLCFVPVPGYYHELVSGSKETNKEASRFEDSSSRAVQSGRYGLLDEAAEFLGRCSTKRVVALTRTQALTLLETCTLGVSREKSNGCIESDMIAWCSRWGQHRLQDTMEWSSGAVIATVPCGPISDQGQSTMFLPCVLKGEPNQEGRQIDILAERRLTEAWKRLLQSLQEDE